VPVPVARSPCQAASARRMAVIGGPPLVVARGARSRADDGRRCAGD
jgi:hypothetical protein